MNAKRLALWSALASAVVLAVNAQAAVLAYNFSATNPGSSTPTSFSFLFTLPYVLGPFNFGEHEISAVLLAEASGGGAALTSTLAEAQIDGVDAGLDLFFDCTVADTGSATCNDSASGAISTAASGMFGVRVDFTLSPGDTVNVTGSFEISQVPEPATLALLGIALAGLGYSRRKRATN